MGYGFLCFGADLGAEKFLDIKCRIGGLIPDCVVLVATIRALKYHGGAEKSSLSLEDTQALKNGLPNLLAHIDNIRDVYQLPCVVALNSFVSDTDDEIEIVKRACDEKGVEFALARNWEEGSAGAVDLASKVIDVCENGGSDGQFDFEYCYGDNLSAEEKIEAVVKKIYHGKGVVFEAKASRSLQKIHEMNLDSLPICIAKTQYSFSDHANALGAPKDFDVTIRDVKACTGAGFIVALAGNIMTMPGLGKKPAAMSIDVDDKGQISGLF